MYLDGLTISIDRKLEELARWVVNESACHRNSVPMIIEMFQNPYKIIRTGIMLLRRPLEQDHALLITTAIE